MIIAAKSSQEQLRLEELKSFGILDTIGEQEYDSIVNIAAKICQTNLALLTFIEEERQWFKACFGTELTETSREVSFCSHAILKPNETMVVNDARVDERFHDNPLVTSDPNIVFYAGVPLVSENGQALGTLCVLDQKSMELSEFQLDALRALADYVIELLNLRRKLIKQGSVDSLAERAESMSQFAMTAAHDLKSPLNNILGMTELLANETDHKELKKIGEGIKNSASRLVSLIDGLLEFSETNSALYKNFNKIDLKDLIDEVKEMLIIGDDTEIVIGSSISELESNENVLKHVFLNLISNSIKYSDKAKTRIEILAREDEDSYCFNVTDNGSGIMEEDLIRVFELFETGRQIDRYGNLGNGIGLANVKRMVEALDGSIKAESEIGQFTTVKFSIGKYT